MDTGRNEDRPLLAQCFGERTFSSTSHSGPRVLPQKSVRGESSSGTGQAGQAQQFPDQDVLSQGETGKLQKPEAS